MAALRLPARAAVAVSVAFLATIHFFLFDGGTAAGGVGVPSHAPPAITDAKPYFVIHVGPPKTATTYLQEELASYKPLLLREDNVAYEGSPIGDALRDRPCQERAMRLRLEEEKAKNRSRIHWTAAGPGAVPECWSRFLLGLGGHLRDARSVIVSSEPLSFPKYRPVWDLIQRDLSEEWHVVVIVGYRRLADWLPSKKQQGNRWTPLKPKLNAWPGAGGRECERTIDWIRHEIRQGSPMCTREILDSVPTGEYGMDTRVLDIHGSGEFQSVRSDFFCRTLSGVTPNACAESQRSDSMRNASISNPRQTEFYDALGTAAATGGFLGKDPARFYRRHVALAIQHHQERVINKTSADFALDCPTRTELEHLLNASLAMEMDIARRGFIASRLDDHARLFWEKADQYCWINASTVLAQEEWSVFFRGLRENQ